MSLLRDLPSFILGVHQGKSCSKQWWVWWGWWMRDLLLSFPISTLTCCICPLSKNLAQSCSTSCWEICQVSYSKSIVGMSHSRSGEFGGELWLRDLLLSIAISTLTCWNYPLWPWNSAQSCSTLLWEICQVSYSKSIGEVSHSSSREFHKDLWLRDLLLSIAISTLMHCIHTLSSWNSAQS